MGGGSQTTNQNSTYTPNSQAYNAYSSLLPTAQQVAQTPWNPATSQSIAGFSPQQMQAFGQIGAMQGGYKPYMDAAGQYAAQGAAPISDSAISRYMNPFQNDVINSTMAQMGQMNAQQQNQVVGNSIAQGALGGDRVKVAQGVLAGQQGMSNASTLAGLNSQNYGQALGAAQGDRSAAAQAGYQFGNLGQLSQSLGYNDANALLQSGGMQQNQQQNVNNAASQNAQSQTMWPYQNAQWLASILGGLGPLMGGTTNGSATTTQNPGLGSILGAGLAFGGLLKDGGWARKFAGGGDTSFGFDGFMPWAPIHPAQVNAPQLISAPQMKPNAVDWSKAAKGLGNMNTKLFGTSSTPTTGDGGWQTSTQTDGLLGSGGLGAMLGFAEGGDTTQYADAIMPPQMLDANTAFDRIYAGNMAKTPSNGDSISPAHSFINWLDKQNGDVPTYAPTRKTLADMTAGDESAGLNMNAPKPIQDRLAPEDKPTLVKSETYPGFDYNSVYNGTAPEPAEPAKAAGKYPSYIESAAQANGLDPATLAGFAQIESSGNPNARTGRYRGLFQLSPDEFDKYGGGDINNPADNANAAARKISAERDTFVDKYGREPTASELYMIHQQGWGGYQAHTSNPDAPAWQNMASTAEGQQKGPGWAKQAIWGNIPTDVKKQFPDGVDSVTSADFTKIWEGKVQNASAGQSWTPNKTAGERDQAPASYGQPQAGVRSGLGDIQDAVKQIPKDQQSGLLYRLFGVNPLGLNDKDRQILLSTGFGMLAGGPFTAQAIGKGGLSGLQTYQGLQDKERAASVEAQKLALEAEKIREPKFTQTGEDAFGNKQFGFVHPSSMTVTRPGGSPGQTSGASTATTGIDLNLMGDSAKMALQAADPVRARRVQSILDGNAPVPTGRGRTPQDKEDWDWANRISNGQVTVASYPAMAAARKKLSSGAWGDVVIAANKTINHVSDMYGHIDPLHNFSSDWFNQATGPIARQYSKPYQEALANLSTDKIGVAGELAKVFKGNGSSSLSEIDDWKHHYSEYGSPTTLHTGAKESLHLLMGQLDPLAAKINQELHTNYTGYDLLSPEAKAKYEKIMGSGAASQVQAPVSPGARPVGMSNIQLKQSAQAAIARGVDPAKVQQRLQQWGIQ